MQHPDEGTIHAWLDDALPPGEAASVAAHVDACEQCAAAVAEARGLIAGASRIVSSLDVVRGVAAERRSGGVVERGSGVNKRSVWGTLHLTPSRAGLVAAVLIGIVLVEGRGGRTGNNAVVRSQMPVVGTTDSVMAASAPASAPVSSPAAPAAAGAAVSKRAENSAATKRVAPSDSRAEAKTEKPSAKNEKPAAKSEEPSAKSEKPAAKSESGLPAAQLQEIVTTGVTASTAKIAPSLAPASSSPAAAPVRRTAASGARAPERENAATAGFTRMRAADLATGGNFEGCYDVQQAPATSLRPLPDRFALERTTTPTGATENIVRPIEPDGRRAEPLPNGEWRQVSQAAANVTWVSNGRTRLLTLRAGADGVMGRADSVVVLKTECR